MELITAFGSLGATIILCAFILNQFQIWKDSYLIYDLVNALGSLILIIYAILLDSYPFIILNLVWFALSFRDTIRDYNRNKKRKEKNFKKKWLY